MIWCIVLTDDANVDNFLDTVYLDGETTGESAAHKAVQIARSAGLNGPLCVLAYRAQESDDSAPQVLGKLLPTDGPPLQSTAAVWYGHFKKPQ